MVILLDELTEKDWSSEGAAQRTAANDRADQSRPANAGETFRLAAEHE
jgi:hypothetical protein